MKLSWTHIAVFFIGIILCWYVMRGCNKPDDSMVDTIKSLSAKNDSIATGSQKIIHENDSLKIANKIGDSAYKHTVDSQKVVIYKLEKKVKVTWDSIGVLYTQIRTLYLDHDTMALIEAYNDLGTQLSEAKQQIKEMKSDRDSSDHIRDIEIDRLNGVIDHLQAEISQLKVLLTECTENASKLAKTGLKAAKKAKIAGLISKIGIGLSAVLAVILLSHN